ncbi:MAG: hypothetical protein F4Y03_08090 [Alphaproteobacteria bacterium]|nr:hypothetical protein [Alphaproteobacteria bacterium]
MSEGAFMLKDLAPWITPALIVALFLWLRADIRDLRRDLSARMDSLEARLRAVETGLAELRGRLDGMDSQLAFLRDYITRRNDPAPAPDGDD